MAIQQQEDFIPQADEFSTENIASTLEDRPSSATDSVKSGWGAAEETSKPKEYAKDLSLIHI